jgi:hypothetical protein
MTVTEKVVRLNAIAKLAQRTGKLQSTVRAAVASAHRHGCSWMDTALVLGITRQDACEWFGPHSDMDSCDREDVYKASA